MFRFPPLTKFVKATLVTLLVVFVTQLIVDGWLLEGNPFFDALALRCGPVATLGIHTAWQVFSYVLVARDPVSFLIGGVFFWWVIAPLEQSIGLKQTAQLCFVTTIGAAIPAVLIGLLFPGILIGINPIIIGAIGAFAWMYRFRGKMSFFGVLPLTAMQMLALIVGLSVLMFLFTKSFVDLAADLGAVGTGMLFGHHLSRPKSRRPKKKKRGKDPLPTMDWVTTEPMPLWE